ncbi:hypothetical protein C8J57DRAFT_1230354 [Mycena rebaudengoi]|nr:hypothetical protein C8J57DRAFT_1230354 [Mycena rebaudengoi]
MILRNRDLDVALIVSWMRSGKFLATCCTRVLRLGCKFNINTQHPPAVTVAALNANGARKTYDSLAVDWWIPGTFTWEEGPSSRTLAPSARGQVPQGYNRWSCRMASQSQFGQRLYYSFVFCKLVVHVVDHVSSRESKLDSLFNRNSVKTLWIARPICGMVSPLEWRRPHTKIFRGAYTRTSRERNASTFFATTIYTHAGDNTFSDDTCSPGCIDVCRRRDCQERTDTSFDANHVRTADEPVRKCSGSMSLESDVPPKHLKLGPLKGWGVKRDGVSMSVVE